MRFLATTSQSALSLNFGLHRLRELALICTDFLASACTFEHSEEESLRDLHMASAWVTTLRNAIKAYRGLTATNE